MATPVMDTGEIPPASVTGYGFSEPSTPDGHVNYSTTEVLPIDDGHRLLRQRLSEIWDMNIPSQEKGRLMHAVMTERYRLAQASIRLSRELRHDSPLGEESQGVADSSSSIRSGPNMHHKPLPPMSYLGGLGSDNPYNITMQDLQPSYIPLHTNLPYVAPRRTSQADGENEDEFDAYMLGCQHYKRNVKLQCSTCSRWYPCRFCHNENEEHMLVRAETQNMLCMLCWCAQPAGDICVACGERTAWYYCGICKLWDDDSEKNIYHCNDCGICRVGRGLGKDYFHCKVCNRVAHSPGR